ncbi:MAG: acetolactate decarboxylase [Cyanobacteriota bacterium]
MMLDGVCWQARGDGMVRVAPDDCLAPFWAATRFQADQRHQLRDVRDWADLMARLDGFRSSANLFLAIRLHGRFDWIRARTACKSPPGMDLATATAQQVEFEWQDLEATMMGFWTPAYARTINVPGYHLHLLSDDHRHGGHELDLRATQLELELQCDTQLQLALPETEAFLRADLNGDPTAVLDQGLGGSS